MSILFVSLVGLYTATAAAFDWRLRRIPNYVTVPAALLGLAYHAYAGGGAGALMALAGFAVGFGLLLLPWLFGGGGMGDVKLLAALGAWLGPALMLVAFAASILLAALLALLILLGSAATQGVSKTKTQFMNAATGDEPSRRTARRRRVLPFAVPVALSTWGLLAWSLFK